jgi:hypothetical protein
VAAVAGADLHRRAGDHAKLKVTREVRPGHVFEYVVPDGPVATWRWGSNRTQVRMDDPARLTA